MLVAYGVGSIVEAIAWISFLTWHGKAIAWIIGEKPLVLRSSLHAVE